MAQTITNCPRCQQQMAANIQQVFDLNNDPLDKERLLSGQVNLAVCPSCGYQSALGVPLVYHDPEKELLLTFFPSELGMAINEQEKVLGPMINQIVNRLPMEERKAYLLQPQSMLTYDTLIEKILEADGITKEMLQEQEKKINLLRQLMTAADDSIAEIVTQEIAQFDQSFFALFSNLQASVVQSRDENSLKKLKMIQDILLKETPYGRELKVKADSTQKALQDLQALGEKLNQESLLDLVIGAPDDTYLQTLVGLARNGMDYDFFSKLTDRINKVDDDKKAQLTEIRNKILALTEQIDLALQEQQTMRKQVLEAILQEADVEQAILKYARAIDESFLQLAKHELEETRKKGDFIRSGKIQSLLDQIDKMSKIPPEIEFLETLIEKDGADEISAEVEKNKDQVTDEFRTVLDSFITEIGKQPDQQKELLDKLNLIKGIISL